MSAFVADEITRYEGPFPYIDGLILQVTQNIDRLLVRHLPRAIGRSNYTMRRLLRLWMSMFVNFSVMPLRISTLTGFALSVLGGLAASRRSSRRCSFPAGGLGVAVRRGAAAVGGAADDPRHCRRISRPALFDREPQAAIGGTNGDASSIGPQGTPPQPVRLRRQG